METQIIRSYHHDGTLAGGLMTSDPEQLAVIASIAFTRGRSVVIERSRPLQDSWNHRVIGVGQYHSDAQFSEQRP
jgi:hypothetical protein